MLHAEYGLTPRTRRIEPNSQAESDPHIQQESPITAPMGGYGGGLGALIATARAPTLLPKGAAISCKMR